MSFLSRMRSIVSGDDGETTEDDNGYDYNSDEGLMGDSRLPDDFSSPASAGHEVLDMPQGLDKEAFSRDNVIGMPGISNELSEVIFMKPRNFDEMPRAIQALRERRTIILNLTQMDAEEAQRAVDFVSGGNFATDGSQERLGEGIFLFAPSCVKVTLAEAAQPTPPPPGPPATKPEPPQPTSQPPVNKSYNGHVGLQPPSFVPDVNFTPFSGELPPL